MTHQKVIEFDFAAIILMVLKRYKIDLWPEQGNFSQAPTGEPYIVVCSQGIKEEGGMVEYYSAQTTAVNAWIARFGELLRHAMPESLLYWRRMPKLVEHDDRFFVYSRFLISNSPQIQSADYNHNL